MKENNSTMIISAIMMMMIVPIDSFSVIDERLTIGLVRTFKYQQLQKQQQKCKPQQTNHPTSKRSIVLFESLTNRDHVSNNINQRRNIIKSSLSIMTTTIVTAFTSNLYCPANAIDTTTMTKNIEMKSFIDPLGLFTVQVPSRFYTVRRTAKGDLPDEITGKGRRGSSIFTAGDMAKAEIIAIER
jgi:hypothetical protein